MDVQQPSPAWLTALEGLSQVSAADLSPGNSGGVSLSSQPPPHLCLLSSTMRQSLQQTMRCHDCNTFCTFPTGRGYDRYPSVDWTLVVNLGQVRYPEWWFHRCFQPIVAISFDFTGSRATAVGLRPQQAGFSCQMLLQGLMGCSPPPPSHLPPAVCLRCPLSSFGVSVDSCANRHNCVTLAVLTFISECLCFTNCETQISVDDADHHLSPRRLAAQTCQRLSVRGLCGGTPFRASRSQRHED